MTTVDEEVLSTNLHPLQSLVDEGFRAAVITAGDSVGAAISDTGDLRVWGTFRVSLLTHYCYVELTRATH